MIFLLVLNGKTVDSADKPGQLNFTRVSAQSFYEVCVCIDDVTYPIAAINMTGYHYCSDFVAEKLCEEIDFRSAFPNFADEIKLVDGPIITFGEPNIGSDGRMS